MKGHDSHMTQAITAPVNTNQKVPHGVAFEATSATYGRGLTPVWVNANALS